ncbi:cell envelope biogenesis protein LolA [Salinisphaera orenii MK-B5]|uniref:Outer-membrane lipoprotein carrier protein n=2 Tax=Salinisphaera orenii TaxID=856731 RepID=A0A423PK32_9GAMM|nr:MULTISPECIES: outer membrane lipoprotein chaperone LolA [Salinisphaera]ROO22386.1 cell envelope biogenesis protein LolA [Salinisphaera halophila YIM 95161]ROO25966.1 cell envelope biogenesis protein LolA [Salinisphaera orenii MK-B5]
MPVRRLLVFGLLLLAAPFAQANGVDDLEAFYDRVDTLTADFEQRQIDDRGNVMQRASGIFVLSRPDRFRWAYQDPYEQIIVSDGNVFRFYDVDLAQVTVRDIDATLRATPALLLTGGAALEDAFNISAAGNRDGMSWVRLTPRADDTDFEEVRLGLDDQVPAVMELQDSLGQTTRIRFSNVEINPAIDDDRFTLDIPDDVEVVDGRGMNGGGRR